MINRHHCLGILFYIACLVLPSAADGFVLQTFPPEEPAVDGNGTDLSTGTASASSPVVSIGGDGGLSYQMTSEYGGWSDNVSGRITSYEPIDPFTFLPTGDPIEYYVSIG